MVGIGLNGPEISHGGILHIFLLQFQMGQVSLIQLSLILLQFPSHLVVKSKIIVLLIVCDDLIRIQVSILQLLMVTTTLQCIPSSYEPRHLLVQFADPEQIDYLPSLFLGSHLFLVEFDVDNILSVLFFAPFAVLLARNITLLLLGTAVALFTGFAATLRVELFAVFHFGVPNLLQIFRISLSLQTEKQFYPYPLGIGW